MFQLICPRKLRPLNITTKKKSVEDGTRDRSPGWMRQGFTWILISIHCFQLNSSDHSQISYSIFLSLRLIINIYCKNPILLKFHYLILFQYIWNLYHQFISNFHDFNLHTKQFTKNPISRFSIVEKLSVFHVTLKCFSHTIIF